MDHSGMEKRDDLGVRDQVDDLISSIVGPEYIKCQAIICYENLW